jgi:hypothetical protein
MRAIYPQSLVSTDRQKRVERQDTTNLDLVALPLSRFQRTTFTSLDRTRSAFTLEPSSHSNLSFSAAALLGLLLFALSPRSLGCLHTLSLVL